MKHVFLILISIPLVHVAIASALILSQPVRPFEPSPSLDFQAASQTLADLGEGWIARGGAVPVRFKLVDNAPLVVVVHGSGWYGGGYSILAQSLSNAGFSVLLPDLRGHGQSSAPRGDVDYIGQLEDDLARLITEFQTDQPVAMVGHSSGGGLVIRFAGGTHGDLLDHAVLIAPYLKYNAPTMRENAGGWNHVLTRRIIGISMLNMIGINWFDHLTIIQFNFPEFVLAGSEGKMATQSYSYRMNQSYSPRSDYKSDIAALPPFLLITGKNDEAFFSDQYEPLMRPMNPNGTFELVPDLGHMDVLNDTSVVNRIADFLSKTE